jgi:hypothetical protein
MKVSWQITGIRNDPYQQAHPFVAEREKPAEEQGHYQHPELYGQPEEKGIRFDRLQSLVPRFHRPKTIEVHKEQDGNDSGKK